MDECSRRDGGGKKILSGIKDNAYLDLTPVDTRAQGSIGTTGVSGNAKPLFF
jgi:hypothetical protein